MNLENIPIREALMAILEGADAAVNETIGTNNTPVAAPYINIGRRKSVVSPCTETNSII